MILVTGASGLLGTHLIESLSKEAVPIKALYVNNKPKQEYQHVTWYQCNICDIVQLEEVFENITHVYHCAAVVSYDSRKASWMHEVNIEGTANVVNMCLDKKIAKLIYVSSIAALGHATRNETLITETSPYLVHANQSQYSKSKYMAELEVWRGIAEGLTATIVCPGIILGEGNWNASSANLFRLAYKEFPYYTLGTTAWVDVKDVVQSMILLMSHQENNKKFIISEGNYSYQKIMSMMALAMQKKEPKRHAGAFLTALVWRWSVLKGFLLNKERTITKETARSAHRQSMYDNSLLINTLKDFTYTPINECIHRVASYYLKLQA
ncbi:MAG: NAD-dependent epimerase/dehydratase family protein [Chitinophagaceae bacterium]